MLEELWRKTAAAELVAAVAVLGIAVAVVHGTDKGGAARSATAAPAGAGAAGSALSVMLLLALAAAVLAPAAVAAMAGVIRSFVHSFFFPIRELLPFR